MLGLCRGNGGGGRGRESRGLGSLGGGGGYEEVVGEEEKMLLLTVSLLGRVLEMGRLLAQGIVLGRLLIAKSVGYFGDSEDRENNFGSLLSC